MFSYRYKNNKLITGNVLMTNRAVSSVSVTISISINLLNSTPLQLICKASLLRLHAPGPHVISRNRHHSHRASLTPHHSRSNFSPLNMPNKIHFITLALLFAPRLRGFIGEQKHWTCETKTLPGNLPCLTMQTHEASQVMARLGGC